MGSTRPQRDQQAGIGILAALHEYGCLTDAQLAKITGRRAGTLRKQMGRLVGAGRVCRMEHRRGSRGRPASVSCLPDSGWDESPSREHQLQLNDVRLAFTLGKRPGQGLLVRIWDTQRVSLDPEASKITHIDHVRPDAVAIIEHERATHPLVVFIELDRGTEAYSRGSTRQSSWAGKAALYQQAEHLAGWRDWALQQASLQGEAVCRLAVITTTAARLAGIDDALQQAVPAVGVWLTRFTEIVGRGPWAEIWHRSGERTPRGFVRTR